MADKVLANLSEACERYQTHRSLKDQSKKFYDSLSGKEKKFMDDWVSAEVWNLSGVYYKQEIDMPTLMLKTWTKLFEKVPRTQKAMYVYRAVGEEHAKEIIDMKAGSTIVLDRYSSFAHSPDMVRNYALLTSHPDVDICIMCIKVPKGTKYAFLSGMKLSGRLSAFDKGDPIIENIDRTQGELILEPVTLVKKKNNGSHLMCEGKYAKTHDRTMKISVVTMSFSRRPQQ